jgi:hypothetical protein
VQHKEVCTGAELGRTVKRKPVLKRKRNPPAKWYVFQKRGRTRFYYDVSGRFTVMGQPKGFRTVEEARAQFERVKLKDQRALWVSNKRPAHAKR